MTDHGETGDEAGLLRTASYTPRELARELGYVDESRPGRVVREFLRHAYPDHPKHQRWLLDEDQADAVRVNVPRGDATEIALDELAAGDVFTEAEVRDAMTRRGRLQEAEADSVAGRKAMDHLPPRGLA